VSLQVGHPRVTLGCWLKSYTVASFVNGRHLTHSPAVVSIEPRTSN
jgi:hypothetical protein